MLPILRFNAVNLVLSTGFKLSSEYDNQLPKYGGCHLTESIVIYGQAVGVCGLGRICSSGVLGVRFLKIGSDFFIKLITAIRDNRVTENV